MRTGGENGKNFLQVKISGFNTFITIYLLAEEVKLLQVWQRGHKESLKSVNGWIIEEGQSQGGLLLQPLVPLSAHPRTQVQIAG